MSSPISKVSSYFIPQNREQCEKFGIEDAFLRGNFDKSKFLEFLNVELPESVPDVADVADVLSRGKASFLTLANKVAKSIKDQHFPRHETLVFKDTEKITPPGHVTDAECRLDITAALENNWENNVVSWPFIRLVGGIASAGTNRDDQKVQATYLHYLLLARPDLYVAQGLLSSNNSVIFYFGIGGEGIWQFEVERKDREFNKLLYAFIYRLYEPGDFADPSYIKTEYDEDTTVKYTIKIAYRGRTKACRGFYPIYAKNPFATRTHVLSNPYFKVGGKVGGDNLTIIKDQLCRVGTRFEELTILNEYVHKPEQVPGVVVAAYGEQIELPHGLSVSKERRKHRLGLGESGSPFPSIPTVSEMLETLFDVLEVLRYLRLRCNVLHRDISAGNVLYVQYSSNRSLPPNSVPIPSAQEAETTGLPLCYAKHLLGKSDNPLETSMLLVDFNVAEHLEYETSVEGKQIGRTGTPLSIPRAVELGKPVPPVFAITPGIPNSPDTYAKAHPDRVEKFPSSKKGLVIDPNLVDNESHDAFKHELNHDAESIFWLLLYWAMVVQPEGYFSEEKIDAGSWGNLNGNYEARQSLLLGLPIILSKVTHSVYKNLQPLIKGLAAILVNDGHWLPAEDPRKDPFYITEAFQRLILNFIIVNSGKEFMDHPVDKTFRDVHDVFNSTS